MPETNQNIENPIAAVVEQLAAARGVATMSPAEAQKVRDELTEMVKERVEDVMLGALSDEQLAELEKRLSVGMSDEQMQEFFLSAGVDYKPLLEQEMAKIKQENA